LRGSFALDQWSGQWSSHVESSHNRVTAPRRAVSWWPARWPDRRSTGSDPAEPVPVRLAALLGTGTFFNGFDAISIADRTERDRELLPPVDHHGQLDREWGIPRPARGGAGRRSTERADRPPPRFCAVPVCFGLLSLLAALSWSGTSLLVFRLLQGIELARRCPSRRAADESPQAAAEERSPPPNSDCRVLIHRLRGTRFFRSPRRHPAPSDALPTAERPQARTGSSSTPRAGTTGRSRHRHSTKARAAADPLAQCSDGPAPPRAGRGIPTHDQAGRGDRQVEVAHDRAQYDRDADRIEAVEERAGTQQRGSRTWNRFGGSDPVDRRSGPPSPATRTPRGDGAVTRLCGRFDMRTPLSGTIDQARTTPAIRPFWRLRESRALPLLLYSKC